ncbi:complement component 1 Q subcomponent-binding protein, mitochondrial-like [Cloeon dipterum]|uniref:complement component 1 Q subcomponent-binding protein, mitochondrial-like n=1 Tax=Cloeon dipterum TaxID=197152 RepID=UPI00321F6174
MNNIVKAAARISSMRSILNPVRQLVVAGPNASTNLYTRTLWHMCSSSSANNQMLKTNNHSLTCSCCNHQKVHTKAEKDLVDFLTDEISTEKKTQKQQGNIPKELDGFKIEAEGSELELSKESGKERIKIYFNINHTVDADGGSHQEEHQEISEMRSQPTFEVELIRGDEILGLTCSFLTPDHQNPDDEYQDVFSIDEVTMYKGEWKDETYAVSGEILDGNLYDLLMNLLEEKGVSNEFALKLSDFATKYEHNQYVGLLERMQKFVNSK